jgi:hypothetical protein
MTVPAPDEGRRELPASIVQRHLFGSPVQEYTARRYELQGVAMPKFHLSFECWPLAVATFDGTFTDVDYDAMFARFDEAFARQERFVTLNDVRAQKNMPSAKQRARVADWTRTIEPLIAQYSLGYAIVVLSPIARGALTAID